MDTLEKLRVESIRAEQQLIELRALPIEELIELVESGNRFALSTRLALDVLISKVRDKKERLDEQHASLEDKTISLVEASKKYGVSTAWLQKSVDTGRIKAERGPGGPGGSSTLNAKEVAVLVEMRRWLEMYGIFAPGRHYLEKAYDDNAYAA